MSYKGTIKNGVVVLEPGANPPEGAPVRVELLAKPVGTLPELPVAPDEDPLFDMSNYAVDCGIPDLAVNLDHYLYGHPKVTDGK
jgi:hypothetical protein